MNVGWISARSWNDPTGIGNYSRRLINELLQQGVSGYLIGSDRDKTVVQGPPVLAIAKNSGNRSLERWRAPGILRRTPVSLLHFLNLHELYYRFPPAGRSTVTIHGFAALHLPRHLHERMGAWARAKYRALLRRTDLLIAVSNATRDDLVRFFDLPAEGITVVHHGVHHLFRPSSSADRESQHPGGGLPYLLAVGATIPKKNLLGVVRAMSILKSRGTRLRLIHAGPHGWGHAEILSEVDRLNLRSQVVFRGRVTEEDLVSLYQQAVALCFPSWHEGFGMPILEAMACGCPVITSNVHAMPEVAGDAALLVDPADPDEIAAAAERLLTDGSLRKTMIGRGFVRASLFSWERCASETNAAYLSIDS